MVNVFKQLNWVDIVAVIILFRICYVALQNGLFLESFKLLGTILALYLSLHYYVLLAAYLANRIGGKNTPLESLNLLSFVALAIAGYFIFRLLRGAFAKFIKIEPTAGLDKWGGFILGVARGFLSISLVIFMLAVFPSVYLKKSVRNSFSGPELANISCALYSVLWNSVMSKFMNREKFNKNIAEAQKAVSLRK